MKKGLLSLLAVVPIIIVSCSGRPAIPEKAMKNICRDMFLLEKHLLAQPDMITQADTTYLYKPLIEKYGYTVEEFRSSLKWYLSDPENFSSMMKDVQSGMNKRIAELEAEEASELDDLQIEQTRDSPREPVIEGREKEDIEDIEVENELTSPVRPRERRVETLDDSPHTDAGAADVKIDSISPGDKKNLPDKVVANPQSAVDRGPETDGMDTQKRLNKKKLTRKDLKDIERRMK